MHAHTRLFAICVIAYVCVCVCARRADSYIQQLVAKKEAKQQAIMSMARTRSDQLRIARQRKARTGRAHRGNDDDRLPGVSATAFQQALSAGVLSSSSENLLSGLSSSRPHSTRCLGKTQLPTVNKWGPAGQLGRSYDGPPALAQFSGAPPVSFATIMTGVERCVSAEPSMLSTHFQSAVAVRKSQEHGILQQQLNHQQQQLTHLHHQHSSQQHQHHQHPTQQQQEGTLGRTNPSIVIPDGDDVDSQTSSPLHGLNRSPANILALRQGGPSTEARSQPGYASHVNGNIWPSFNDMGAVDVHVYGPGVSDASVRQQRYSVTQPNGRYNHDTAGHTGRSMMATSISLPSSPASAPHTYKWHKHFG